jgi:hypothetical protein
VLNGKERAKCFRQGANKYRLSNRDKQREYEDLIAQRKSALWSMIMGVAALICMALSALGVALVWLTFDEQRKANRLAQEEANRAKAETNAIARSFLSAQRPRIFAVSLREMAYANQVLILNIANAGQSPAIIENVALMVCRKDVRVSASGGKKFGYINNSRWC